MLPTGQILFTLADGSSMNAEIYTPNGTFQHAWAPAIKLAPTTITRGSTYQILGTQFNGVTQGRLMGMTQMSSLIIRWYASPTTQPGTLLTHERTTIAPWVYRLARGLSRLTSTSPERWKPVPAAWWWWPTVFPPNPSTSH